MNRIGNRAAGRRGLSLLEVLIALAILTAGILTIMAIFPYTLRAQRDAELLSEAAALAQMKVEEIRRDSPNGILAGEIENMDKPAEPAIIFPNESRLAYTFSGKTLLYPDLTPPVPPVPSDLQYDEKMVEYDKKMENFKFKKDPGARVIIIRWNPSLTDNYNARRYVQFENRDVIYELRFK